MRITLSGAMRARDVSRPSDEQLAAAAKREEAAGRAASRPGHAPADAAEAAGAAGAAVPTAPVASITPSDPLSATSPARAAGDAPTPTPTPPRRRRRRRG
jgi:hypothetical protein